MSILNNSMPLENFSTIESQLHIATDAAYEQLNFLFGFSSDVSFFKSEDLQAMMLRYQNQITQMGFLQQQCEHWLETELLSKDQKTAIYQLEIDGFKLRELSEKIITKLNAFHDKLVS